MDRATQRQFIAQLAHWAQQACDDGRFPFRKIETEPELLTEQGPLQLSCLVLWINRASCMAGAIIFFPDANQDISQQAAAAARSLGLKFYVYWTPHAIEFWQLLEQGQSLAATTDLSSDMRIEQFRNELRELLNTLKPWSVTGQIPASQLPPEYFVNLCQLTLRQMRPQVQQAIRQVLISGEGDNPQSWNTQAEHKLGLTLLRLLAVIVFEELPAEAQPERLEQAMDYALDRLPAALAQPLRFAEGEPPLPADSLVSLHHLFRRLIQLDVAAQRSCLAEVLRLFLAEELFRQFLKEPVSMDPVDQEPAIPALLVNTLPEQTTAIQPFLVAAPPIIAAETFLRVLESRPQLAGTFFSALSVPISLKTTSIKGALVDKRIVSAGENRRLTTLLRLSWPHHRFSLPNRTPVWVFEFLHLLGVATQTGRLEITVPEDWLTLDFGLALWSLIREQHNLSSIDRLSGKGVRLVFAAQQENLNTQVSLRSELGQLQANRNWLSQAPRCLLVAALHLPKEIQPLLTSGVLSCSEHRSLSSSVRRGAFLFLHSSLGHYLWNLVSDRRPLPKMTNLASWLARVEMPLPEDQFLHNLSMLSSEAPENVPLQVLDREIEQWLGSDVTAHLPTVQKPEAERKPTRQKSRPTLSLDAIVQQVFRDGIPLFPEHYLLHARQEDLQAYALPGPLEIVSEFFDQVTLSSPDGESLEVAGMETAKALQLASLREVSEVWLPRDRTLTEQIVSRYRQDLLRLRTQLLQETHRHEPDAAAATQAALNIWESLHLPPWSKLLP